MFELSVQGTFSAAHRVRGYKGDCAGMHGHTYRVEVRVAVKELNRLGMTVDFRKVKKVLEQNLKKLDHKNLNTLPFFKKHNATAEWIAVYLYKEMKKKIKNIESITVWEGNENSVTYYE
ncbi:MAG TPA: 6-carboxytetrahydropterin synthase QueD [candidate division WOR-3 bacterium]|uniref:6-carboxy-5,6,7,8-tetrahydropterin synthase n=1 Tax=candidate division WOR-3 bacterium TaxID=2052148 RepID=A0A9C9ELH5_UNCW3|nr:6-carboxytetrahydropterin synthase QueD [candidate division WOR-3 bacterium]